MKLGYFTASEYKISETFIEDLISGLNREDSIELEYFYWGEEMSPEKKLKSHSLGLKNKFTSWQLRLVKLFALMGFDRDQSRMLIEKRIAKHYLTQRLNLLSQLDVAYIDFSTTAVTLYESLTALNIPMVVHVHGYDITSELNNKAYHMELKKIFKISSKFVTASVYMKRRLVLLGCLEDKIEVIRYGLNSNNIEVIDWDERLRESPSIIFLGRLTPKKSPIALIYAFYYVLKDIANAKLSIIGDGPLKKDVEALVDELGIRKNVTFYGALNREKSFPIMAKHWVYAQHSVTPISGDTEGFALSLAEAALHEIPVVSTIHNGITENVVEGVTGFLVPEYDYEKMATRIIQLLKDPILLKKMGKAGRNHILLNYQPQKRLESIRQLLESIDIK